MRTAGNIMLWLGTAFVLFTLFVFFDAHPKIAVATIVGLAIGAAIGKFLVYREEKRRLQRELFPSHNEQARLDLQEWDRKEVDLMIAEHFRGEKIGSENEDLFRLAVALIAERREAATTVTMKEGETYPIPSGTPWEEIP